MSLKQELKKLKEQLEAKENELLTQKLNEKQLLRKYSQTLWQFKSLVQGILKTIKK